MMYSSCEIRWFFEGKIPEEIFHWYLSIDKDCQQQSPRIDHYLKLPKENSLGIKLREGRIEIKKQNEKPSLLKINEKVSGYSDCWEKWSFELNDPNPLPIAVPGFKEWIAVEKKRQLFLFEVADGNCFVKNPHNGLLKNGCIAELTSLTVDNIQGWTIGLEAFGETSNMKNSLLVVCSHIFSGQDCPTFKEGNSISYPGWLRTLI